MIVPHMLKAGPVPRQLFNLREDIGETLDVQNEHPDVVKLLEELVERHRDDLRKNSRPIGRLPAPATGPVEGRNDE